MIGGSFVFGRTPTGLPILAHASTLIFKPSDHGDSDEKHDSKVAQLLDEELVTNEVIKIPFRLLENRYDMPPVHRTGITNMRVHPRFTFLLYYRQV